MSTGPRPEGAPDINVTVDMVRDDLCDFPLYRLSPGYRFRMYALGDEAAWMALQYAAEPFFVVAPNLFEREFGSHVDALSDRMFLVETDAGAVVASITAWWERAHEDPDERGRIHWVVVHPDHQGRGLAKPMMTAAMQRLAQSHRAAVLGTSTGRIWAIKTYLDFGFHPDPAQMEAKPETVPGWQAVQERLQHPLLAAWLPPR
jgi:GNAT superfamily N-acetyltransferase